MAGFCAVAAVQLAITRQDVASVQHILAAGFPMFTTHCSPENFNSFRQREAHMLGSILCPHCQPLSQLQPSYCQPQAEWSCCWLIYGHQETNSHARKHIRNLILAAVGERRTRLTELALQNLSSRTLDELGIRDSARPLDGEAFAAYTALRDAGIPVPTALYPGERALLLSFNPVCHFDGLSVAQQLFDSGLCDINASFDCFTPLVRLFNEFVAGGRKQAVIRWFLEHGANPAFADPKMLPNFLFYLATVYDRPSVYNQEPHVALSVSWSSKREMILAVPPGIRKTTSEMIGLVSQFCDPVQRDACRCPCSSAGCLPLHKFKNAVAVKDANPHPRAEDPEQILGWIPHRWAGLSDTVQAWIQDCSLEENQKREYLRDACRLEVFTRLGMAHVCCGFGHSVFDPSFFPSRHQRDPETVRELEDEDIELHEQLELILEAYDQALEKHKGTVDEFWGWWWGILQPLLPEIPSQERRRTFGDYFHAPPDLIRIGRAVHPDPDWEFYWPDDEREEKAEDDANVIWEGQAKDFVAEIREYFATILSQDSLGSNGTQKSPSVVADVLRGAGGDERGSGDAAAED